MNLKKTYYSKIQLHELNYDSRHPCLSSGATGHAVTLRKRTLFPTLMAMTRELPDAKLKLN